MAISENDKFMYPGSPGTATTLSSPGYTTGVDTGITVGTTASFPTLTGCIFAIDTAEVVTTNGVAEEVQVVGTYTVYSGTVTNGTTIGNVTLLYGTAQSYAAGALTRVYIPVSALYFERLVGGLLVSLGQDGLIKGNASFATTAGDIGGAGLNYAATQTGWTGDLTNAIYRYTKVGKIVTLFVRHPTVGTSNATTKTISLPIAAKTLTNMAWGGYAKVVDNSINIDGFWSITSADTTVSFFCAANAAFTNSGNCRIANAVIIYEVA